ncbi:antibiotic biosynthesis monooxygenase family protein [Fodinibius saliphilus]|uniref:antibiotic biosynthesis monooxygenase family protein n=1 Tax=Fodinibius saliphilus TaxID=1920650 RepID=UPI001108AF7A|nr:antibiotic biosynthesis monooxygenase [Fodinibius saliphilus]
MIIVHIKHFLNQQGEEYFGKWVSEVADILSDFKGFISLEIIEEIDEASESQLLLRFEDEPLLRKWADSPEHDALVSKLFPYQLKPYSSQTYQVKQSFDD